MILESLLKSPHSFSHLVLSFAEILIIVLILTMVLFEWLRTKRNYYGLLGAVLIIFIPKIIFTTYMTYNRKLFFLDSNTSIFVLDIIKFIFFLFLGPAILYRFINDVKRASFLLTLFAFIGVLTASIIMVFEYFALPFSEGLIIIPKFMPFVHMTELIYPLMVLTGSWPWLLKFSGFDPNFKMREIRILSIPFLLFAVHEVIDLISNSNIAEGGNIHIVGETFTTLAIFSLMILVYEEIIHELTENYENSTKDRMTGLLNYGYLVERLREEVKRAFRYGTSISFAMIDIDFFKKYNDEFGHLAGDEFLKELAKVMTVNVRDTDLVFRYGGEEFAILFADTKIKQAKEITERVRQKVSELNLRRKVTISIGISGLECDCLNKNSENVYRDLIHFADKALYAAKNRGRNQIVMCIEDKSEIKIIPLETENKIKT